MEQRAKVTKEGRITIPKEIRRALGIREGDSLLFEADTGEVRVRFERKPVSFADYAGIWREGKGMSWEEVNAFVHDLRGHSDEVEAR